jgi:hypothetical protein
MSSRTWLSRRGEGAEPQVLQAGHVGDDPAAFHHLEYAAPDDLVRVDAIDLFAGEADVATGDSAVFGLQQAGDGFQRCRFAGPVGAQQGHDLAFRDLEAEATQDQDHVVVDDLDIVDREQGRFSGCNRRCRYGVDVDGGGHGLQSCRTRRMPGRFVPSRRMIRLYQPSHSFLRGRSMLVTFSSLIVPAFTSSSTEASVAPETLAR